MTTAVEYHLKVSNLRHLNWLLNPTHDGRCVAENATRQEVLNELRDRALMDFAASSQGVDELVVALGAALTGKLATFTDARLVRTLGVLADQADERDWIELAKVKLPYWAVVDSLHELALSAA